MHVDSLASICDLLFNVGSKLLIREVLLGRDISCLFAIVLREESNRVNVTLLLHIIIILDKEIRKTIHMADKIIPFVTQNTWHNYDLIYLIYLYEKVISYLNLLS